MDNYENEDVFSRLMFGEEIAPSNSNNENSNPTDNQQNSQKLLYEQLKNVDIVALSNNLNNVMKIANDIGPVIKQISPLLELFKKKS